MSLRRGSRNVASGRLRILVRPDVAILDAGPRLREFAVLVGALIPRFPELNLIVTYRDASRQDLAAATRAGIAYLVPESHGLAAVLSLLRRGPGRHTRAGQGGLSERELELVGLTGSGHSVSEIAALLKLSPLTVENLKRCIYAKMGVHSGAHAVSGRSRSACLTSEPHQPRAGRHRPPGNSRC